LLSFCNDEKIVLPKFQKDFMPAIFLNHGYAEFDRNKFKQMVEQTATSFNVLKLGTTALELCYVATGSMDAFICSGDAIWDFAGGAVIATEAGCKFTDWNGKPWDGKGNQLLFARPEVHEYLVNKLMKV
jgi:myo-inositol-1(or 4)-monophosphatase